MNNVIKEARESKNIKQDDVASYVGVTVQTYSKWENNKTEPKASQIKKLSEILKISEKEICKGELTSHYNLEDFMNMMASISKDTDAYSQLIAIWNSCDHNVFFENLKKQQNKAN